MDELVIRIARRRADRRIRGHLNVFDELPEPHRPAVDKGVRCKQAIDRLIAFIEGGVGGEGAHGRRIRNLAGEIERHAAQEFFVGGTRSPDDSVTHHLAEDLGIDEIARGEWIALRWSGCAMTARCTGVRRDRFGDL